jgi:hypothetical protein
MRRHLQDFAANDVRRRERRKDLWLHPPLYVGGYGILKAPHQNRISEFLSFGCGILKRLPGTRFVSFWVSA